jgi:hypothetical protein
MISNYLSGSGKKRDKHSKIDITMATVVPRLPTEVSHQDIFSGDFGGNAADLAPSLPLSNDLL